jgi:hypothetical protein
MQLKRVRASLEVILYNCRNAKKDIFLHVIVSPFLTQVNQFSWS